METPDRELAQYVEVALRLNGLDLSEEDLAETTMNFQLLEAHVLNFQHIGSLDTDEIALRFEARGETGGD